MKNNFKNIFNKLKKTQIFIYNHLEQKILIKLKIKV